MKALLFVLVILLLAPLAQAQIIRADSSTFKPATAWDSLNVSVAGRPTWVWIGAKNLSGSSVIAYAVGNDTAANSYKRLYVFPGDGLQWFPPVLAKYIRRKAIGGDSCNVETFILSRSPQLIEK